MADPKTAEKSDDENTFFDALKGLGWTEGTNLHPTSLGAGDADRIRSFHAR
jgi:hypothetical protein